jgi:hypothetical protein
MWTLEEELALREDLIEKVISKANEGDGMLSRVELGSFSYAGQTIRVIDLQGDFAEWSGQISEFERFAELLLNEKPVTAAL